MKFIRSVITLVYGYGNWDIIEAPVSALDMSQAREFADVALVKIGRQGGEQGDLPTNMGDDTFYKRENGIKFGYNPDKHYLELTDEEEALIAAIKQADFDKIVVVVNSANAMELGELQTDADRVASDALIRAAAVYDVTQHNDSADKMPVTGAQNGLSVIDMRDLTLYGRNAGNKYLSLAFECGIRLI